MSESTKAIAWAALIVAGSVGLARWMARGPKVTPGESRLLLVGDSMAVGLTPPLKQLAKDANVPFAALAERSTRIDQWAQRASLRQALATFKPTVVVVVLGTNDEYMNAASVEKQKAWLQQLLSIIRGAGAKVAWVGPPSLPKTGPYAHATSNGIRAALEAAIPGEDYFRSDSMIIPRAEDQLHPSVRGAAGWAGAIWRWLT